MIAAFSHRRLALSISLCALVLAGCTKRPTVWVSRQEHHEVAVESATKLAVTTHNGPVTALGVEESGDVVVVEAKVRGGGTSQADAQAALDAIVVIAKREGDTIRVCWDWASPKSNNWRSQVAFEIKLPPALDVRAVTHNGAVVARDLTGECALETHNGEIIAQEIAGDCALSTHNGRITADTTGARARACSHNGALEVITTATDISLETHNGGIGVRLNAEGEVGGQITTHNGGVVIAVAETTATMLHCSTSNGRIHCNRNLDGALVTKTSLKGSLGGGTEVLQIETDNGRIQIR